MSEFDLLIVGAGPAGSFAAELLANRGAKVALFDGRPPTAPKACGGGVTAKALKAWPTLLNAVGRTISELDLYSPSGKRLHLQLDEPFAVYSRVVFDGYLRDRARDAGARVFSEKISARKIAKLDRGWRVTSDSAEWTGRLLVGADGANSGIARMLAGPLAPSDMEVAFGYRAPLPANGAAPTVVAFLPRWVGYAHKHQVRRGTLLPDGTVELQGGESSHLMHALAGSNVLVHVPVGVAALGAGAEVEVWML